jgi:hypothetical protein
MSLYHIAYLIVSKRPGVFGKCEFRVLWERQTRVVVVFRVKLHIFGFLRNLCFGHFKVKLSGLSLPLISCGVLFVWVCIVLFVVPRSTYPDYAWLGSDPLPGALVPEVPYYLGCGFRILYSLL